MPYDWSNPYNSAIPYDVGNPQSIAVIGIASASALGVDLISLGSVSVIISGVSSGMAFGSVNASASSSRSITGIISAEIFSVVATQSPVTLVVQGVISEESFSVISLSFPPPPVPINMSRVL